MRQYAGDFIDVRRIQAAAIVFLVKASQTSVSKASEHLEIIVK
jgi:hypothetical protein